MVLSLQSEERSYFIDNFIGDPFSSDLRLEVQESLVNNLCEPPFAGSFLIFLLDNFEELTNSKKILKGLS